MNETTTATGWTPEAIYDCAKLIAQAWDFDGSTTETIKDFCADYQLPYPDDRTRFAIVTKADKMWKECEY